MNRTSRLHTPPAVDEGDRPTTIALIRRQLRSKPGRLGNAVRVTCVALIVILILETFQAPDAGVGAGMALIIFAGDSDQTAPIGVILAVVVCASIFIAVLAFMTSLAEPAVRIPLMALITCGGMFLFRASKAGAPALLATLIVTYALPSGDNLLKGSLATGTVSDTTSGALPDLAFFPPEEALVHNLLWLAVAFSVPALTASLLNALTGIDPAEKFRGLVAGRLGLIADLCEGRPGAAERVKAAAEQGIGPILAQNELAGKLRKSTHDARAGEDLAFIMSRLVLILLASERTTGEPSKDALAYAATLCRHGERAVRANAELAEQREEPNQTRETTPLNAEMERTLHALRARLEAGLRERPGAATLSKEQTALFHPDAFTNEAYLQFAIKVTLAVMSCYLFESLTAWSGIGTCIVTCFVIAINPAQSAHKALLRVTGAAIGGALGFMTILLLVPVMTDIGHLLVLAAVVAFGCAWVLVGSEQFAYGAQQLWLAFALVVLQGHSPSLHFESARDRVIGVLIGEIVLGFIMLHLWPQRTGDLIRGSLAKALDALADLVALPTVEAEPITVERLQRRFAEAIAATRKLMPDDPETADREGARRTIDRPALLRIQALVIPVAVILGDLPRASPEGGPVAAGDDVLAYHRDLAAWLRRAGTWTRTGTGASELSGSLPTPPVRSVVETSVDETRDEAERPRSREDWYRVLDGDLRSILRDVGPREGNQAREARREAAVA